MSTHAATRTKMGKLLKSVLWAGGLAALLTLILSIAQWRKESKEADSNGTSSSLERGRSSESETFFSPSSGILATETRQLITAQAVGGDWSSWIRVPRGSELINCEANAELECTNTSSDVAGFRYAFQCRDLVGQVHDWTLEACGDRALALRLRSKSEEPLSVAFWLEPFAS